MDTKRVFLVGCPRSGTTLYQSMVASHSRVVSFPETHFFSETLPINPILRKLKLYGPKNRAFVKQFLKDQGYDSLQPFTKSYGLVSHNQWCRQLAAVLDQMIVHDAPDDLENGTVWGLEKTPRHLYYISSIEQAESTNKFLHILRQGKDVVASLHLATKQYPKEWGGVRSIKKCIRWWNASIKESLKYQGKPNHLFVTYEQLLHSPKKVLEATCSFLELNFEEAMIRDFHNTADDLTKDEEEWKEKNAQQSLSKSDKLNRYFDSSTIRYIEKNILDIDLKAFQF